MRKLTVDDIVDMRAYERERDEFRARIIETKKRRRIGLGPLMTIVFENTDTMRFQVQEMARAERMLRDEQIEHEVATYNELIPDPGELSGTLFIEITDNAELRVWLPKLVGIQRARRGRGRGRAGSRRSRSTRSASPGRTRSRRRCTTCGSGSRPGSRPRSPQGPVRLVVDHPEYQAAVELTPDQRIELASDFVADPAPRLLARFLDVGRSRPCTSRSSGSIRTSRSRRSSTPTTPATTCTRASRSCWSRAAGARSSPPGSPSPSRRGTPGWCCRGPGSRSSTASPA